ncbi:hypothetical protein [Variovorax saccharolyticus]|uniref:hypothetical protein n=1 Tax=Variovorax saccharolyticus TaxID=3053516 RepID=UPI0025749424|nr:hypothetical protein [Variovorax sp. J31P216]MDM0030193.1 hypothetical protein [Variovorax sp. J31P216]
MKYPVAPLLSLRDDYANDDRFDGVEWLTPLERKKYRVTFANGLAHDSNGSVLDTKKMEKSNNKSDCIIYVMDGEGNFYFNQKTYKKFQHSSFFAGQEVAAAGTVYLSDGVISYIDNVSPRYKPPVENLRAAVAQLKLRSVMSPKCRIVEFEKSTNPVLVDSGWKLNVALYRRVDPKGHQINKYGEHSDRWGQRDRWATIFSQLVDPKQTRVKPYKIGKTLPLIYYALASQNMALFKLLRGLAPQTPTQECPYAGGDFVLQSIDGYGRTPLYEACAIGDVDFAEDLFKGIAMAGPQGIDLAKMMLVVKDGFKSTALHSLIATQPLEIIERFCVALSKLNLEKDWLKGLVLERNLNKARPLSGAPQEILDEVAKLLKDLVNRGT